MTRPPWEVADVIRIAGSRFRERYGASLTWPQVKVLRAIARCRTANIFSLQQHIPLEKSLALRRCTRLTSTHNHDGPSGTIEQEHKLFI